MDNLKKKAKIMLIVSLVMILLCGIVVSAVQTDGGKVTMKEVFLETDSGWTMCAYLFIPDTATAETPAPAVVSSHGYYNNKEMQDANYVELARRGYVVLAVDQADHGDSEIVATNYWDAVYQGALMLSRQPYVDKARIGVTGHSMGGYSSNGAIRADNEAETQVISAVLLNCCSPTTNDAASGEYFNMYGSRKAGVLAAQYDEFFFSRTLEDGTVLRSPYYMDSENAQSFLYFGVDPTGLEARKADTYYYETIDGEETFHVIYRPDIIHPWSHFSKKATTQVIEFFETAFGAPNPIASDNQVWQWKEAFNAVGLVGFALFIVSFGTLMLFTPAFETLRADKPAEPVHVKDRKGKIWFWASLIVSALFATLIYRKIVPLGTSRSVAQPEALGLGFWSTACGLFTILSMVVYYYGYGKKNGFDPVASGVKLGLPKLLKTLLLAVIVVTVSYGLVFVLDYFFYADFRIWTLAVKAFEAPILKYLPYILLFFTYYIAVSVAVNSFNFCDATGKRPWVNTAVLCVFNAFPAIILPWMQYIHYYSAKDMLWPASNMHVLWLFPILLILVGTTIIDRLMYKASKNPYLPGIINAIIVGLLTITNTCTYLR